LAGVFLPYDTNMSDRRINAIEFPRRHAIRRKDVNNISQGAQQKTLVLEEGRQLWPQPRQIAGIGCLQLQRRHSPQSADLGKARIARPDGDEFVDQRLGLALSLERAGTQGDAVSILYDHPSYRSRIEVATTTPLEGG